MARGAPDDSNVRMGVDVFRLEDLAELAVRLGSIVTYNRSGNVLILDGFEEGMNAWVLNRTGVGAAVEVSDEGSYTGQVALKVSSGTGATPYAGIAKYMPPVGQCKIGLQTCFSLNSDVVDIRFQLTYGHDPLRPYFFIMYDHVTGELKYESAPGVWPVFATPGKLFDVSNNWHNFKLIADMVTGEYVRCYLDGEVYDMSGLVPNTGAWAQGPFLYAILRVYGSALTEGVVFFDNVIVTYNEF